MSDATANLSARLLLQIHRALNEAAAALTADPETAGPLRAAGHNLGPEVADIVRALIAEVPPVVARRRSPTPPTTAPSPVLASRTQARAREIYIIVPVCNASDAQVGACLDSLRRNFPAERSCIVLYSNRPRPEWGGLLAAGFDVIRFHEPHFSLPRAYNACVEHLRGLAGADALLVFMDDDAEIPGRQHDQLHATMRLVQDRCVIAASGHYYDETSPRGLFESSIHVTHTLEFVLSCPKPYCHGGAALVLRLGDFPPAGLPLDGLGGISLNVLLTPSPSATTARTGGWHLHNNPHLRVLHPRKGHLLQWSATYLAYEIAWERMLCRLDAGPRLAWRDRLQQSSRLRRARVLALACEGDEHARRVALANLLLTRYYKPRLRTLAAYDSFCELALQTHVSLKGTQ